MKIKNHIVTAMTGTALVSALALFGAHGATAATAAKASAASVTCTASVTKVTVTEVQRPLNHLLITAKNTGTKTCHAYGAPYLRFDEAQAIVPWMEASKPQAVVTLAPGESAYASVLTSAADGSGVHGYTAHRLGVLFSGKAMAGSVGKEATPKLPAAGVYVDSSNAVSYWQQDRDDALAW